jgi:hypothetical protein
MNLVHLKTKKNITFFILLILVVSILIYFHSPTLAQVGDIKISRADAEYRQKIILLNSPKEKRFLGLYQLVKSAINAEILKNNGQPLEDWRIEEEKNRIDKNTKDPEQLKRVKNIFGGDTKAYLKDFVKPALVDHAIYYDFFLNDEKAQRAGLKKTLDFIEEVHKPGADFKKTALKKRLRVVQLEVSLKEGLHWEELRRLGMPPHMLKSQTVPQNANNTNPEVFARIQKSMEKKTTPQKNDEEAQKWFDMVIKPMKEGEVTDAPLNRQEAWLVVHYLHKKSEDKYQLEVVSFPKANYNEWYESEKAKVKIIIHDKSYPLPRLN